MNTDKIKILALDDEPFILLTIAACLKSENYEVITCNNTDKAIEELKKHSFGAILSDIMMEPIDGFKFRDIVRGYDKRVPVIFLTSLLDNIDNTLLSKIMQDSYSYYLNKKFTKVSLLEKLDSAIRQYRIQNEILHLQQKIECDLSLANQVQNVMLPRWIEYSDDYEFSFIYRPLFKVSGDLFEWVQLDHHRVLGVFGDISGHGVHSALIMTAVQSVMRQIIAKYPPEKISTELLLQQLNHFVANNFHLQNYMTCLVAIWDFASNKVVFHSAGHPDLLCIDSRDGRIIDINPEKRGSLPVGMLDDTLYDQANNVEYQFADSAVFFAFTDGIFDLEDADRPNQEFDQEFFIQSCASLVQQGAVAGKPHQLMNALEQIGYNKPTDDMFLFALKKTAEQADTFRRTVIPDKLEIDHLTELASQFVYERSGSIILAVSVEILLGEFLINIVKHGLSAESNSQNLISLQIEIEKELARITVLDRAKIWDESQFKADQNIDELLNELNKKKTSGGRGIPLMLKISPQISRKHFCGVNETIFYVRKDIDLHEENTNERHSAEKTC